MPAAVGAAVNVRERRFDIEGMTLAAREWGEAGGRPLLALHGWLDNAASFDALGEHLRGCHLLALDLPGHGRSDRKPAHATYQIWDDMLSLLAVADAMGWERFSLLGHSRGAIMSTLLAAACPERVDCLVCLDGLVPQPVKVEDTATQLGQFLTDYRHLHTRKPRIHASLDDIVAVRQRAMTIGDDAARRITERAAVEVEGGYVWNSDPRLKAASAFKLTEAHIEAVLKHLTVPVLLILAEDGFARFVLLDKLLPLIKACTVKRLPGSHHFHMEAAAPDIAGLIRQFLTDNPTGDLL